MKGRAIAYSPEELSWIEKRAQWPRAVMHELFVMFFDRRDVSLAHLNSLCKRKGWLTGRTGCFEKGQEPFNKGVKCEEGKGGRHPNARKTQFRKGSMNGRAAERYQPIGTERLCEDGYLERKMHDGLPLRTRWRAVHLVRWEEVNGPVPAGHCLKCLDGNKLNTEPSNWELIPRALLPRLAGGNRYRKTLAYDDAAPEVRPALLAIAKLEHQARTVKRRAA